MPFKVPVVWSDPGLHDQTNCYVCVNNVFGLNRHTSGSFMYIGVHQSAVLPVPFDEGEEGPTKPSPLFTDLYPTSAVTPPDDDDATYQPSNVTDNQPCPMQKKPLDTIVRKLNLTQTQAEILAKELKKAKLLAPNVKVTGYRFRE